MSDHYATLGVAKNAAADEIKKSYRKLVRETHPDKHPDDPAAEERFKQIQQAYEVLSDADKRKQYDLVGDGPRFGGGAGGGFDPRGFNVDDLGDVFGGIFNRGRSRGPRPERGHDLEAAVTIAFRDSLSGAKVTIPVEALAPCDACHGTGAEPGTMPNICPDCEGRGMRSQAQGFFSLSSPCPRCAGSGRIVEYPCHNCAGRGAAPRLRRYVVSIPPGVKDAARIRLRGKGEPGALGGEAGDLYVRVAVNPDHLFTRRGDDLLIDVPVLFSEAAQGATIEVPTAEGAVVRLKVPAGTADGVMLRARGRGAPKNGTPDKRGDLMARVKIVVPKKLSKQQKQALEKFALLEGENPRASLFTNGPKS